MTADKQILSAAGEMVAQMISVIVDCENIAIRIQNEEQDFPICAYRGLSKYFLNNHSSILFENPEGKKEAGCICGMVATGNNEFVRKACNKFGSFWTGAFAHDIQDYLPDIPHIQPYCLKMHLKCAAYIPIKLDSDSTGAIGLFWMGDKKAGIMKEEYIDKLENLSVKFANLLSYLTVMGSQGKCFRILIAEDEQAIANLLSRVLVKFGHVCFTVPNGAEAFDMVQKKRVDLVITDLKMPVMNGYELIRNIRDKFGIYGPRILVFTGSNDVLHPYDFEDLDISGYLFKPLLNILEVQKAVEKAMMDIE